MKRNAHLDKLKLLIMLLFYNFIATLHLITFDFHFGFIFQPSLRWYFSHSHFHQVSHHWFSILHSFYDFIFLFLILHFNFTLVMGYYYSDAQLWQSVSFPFWTHSTLYLLFYQMLDILCIYGFWCDSGGICMYVWV